MTARNTTPSIVEVATRPQRAAQIHAERIAHARDQAIRVEKSLGHSSPQRNSYMKQRRKSYEETKHAGK